MAVRNATTLKSYFQSGDKPTQSQFADLIDTALVSGGGGMSVADSIDDLRTMPLSNSVFPEQIIGQTLTTLTQLAESTSTTSMVVLGGTEEFDGGGGLYFPVDGGTVGLQGTGDRKWRQVLGSGNALRASNFGFSPGATAAENTAALQAFSNALAATGRAGVIDGGSYSIDNYILWTGNPYVITAEPATITLNRTGKIFHFFRFDNGQPTFVGERLTLDGNDLLWEVGDPGASRGGCIFYSHDYLPRCENVHVKRGNMGFATAFLTSLANINTTSYSELGLKDGDGWLIDCSIEDCVYSGTSFYGYSGIVFNGSTGVNFTNDYIEFTDPHGLETGDEVYYTPNRPDNDQTSEPNNVPDPLVRGQYYFVRKLTDNRLSLAMSYAQAVGETLPGAPVQLIDLLNDGHAHNHTLRKWRGNMNIVRLKTSGETANYRQSINGRIVNARALNSVNYYNCDLSGHYRAYMTNALDCKSSICIGNNVHDVGRGITMGIGTQRFVVANNVAQNIRVMDWLASPSSGSPRYDNDSGTAYSLDTTFGANDANLEYSPSQTDFAVCTGNVAINCGRCVRTTGGFVLVANNASYDHKSSDGAFVFAGYGRGVICANNIVLRSVISSGAEGFTAFRATEATSVRMLGNNWSNSTNTYNAVLASSTSRMDFNATRTCTANENLSLLDDTVYADTTAGNVTLTLPNPAVGANSGKHITIIKTVADNALTITRYNSDSGNINAGTTYTVAAGTAYVMVHCVSRNGSWYVTKTTTTGTSSDVPSDEMTGSEATWDPAELSTGESQTRTVTVTGAVLGDYVTAVSHSVDLQGTTLTGYVSAADTVTVVHRNDTAGSVNVGSGTLRVIVRAAE